MTSQELQNNAVPASEPFKPVSFASLLKEDLKHRKWMMILSFIVQMILGPMVALFSYTGRRADYMYYDMPQDPEYAARVAKSLVENITQGYFPVIQLTIAVVGALIVGIGGFRHLFDRRMTDMMNSVPVKIQFSPGAFSFSSPTLLLHR